MILVFAAALLLQAPADEARTLIPKLGSPTWSVRDAAQRRLEGLARADGRILFEVARGLSSRDAEIRMRSHAIVRRVFPCTCCVGSGWAYASTGSYWAPELEPCHPCRGRGSIWFDMYLDPEARFFGRWSCE